jgi:pimeloyl-ACP methyl ester carboxylesterase
MPTLIMWGDHDRIIPVAQGYAAHELMPGSRLEIFEGAGHFPHCEDAERFCRVLVDFMQSTSPSTTSASAWRDRLLAGSV